MKKITFSIKPLAALLLVVFLLCSCSSKVSDDINLEHNQGKNLKEAISNTLQADVVPGENLPPSISYSNEVYKSISFSILSKNDRTGVASVEFTYVDVLSLADTYSGPSKNLDLFYAHCIQEIASGNAKTITETAKVSYTVLTEGKPKIYTIDHIENIANILTGGSVGYIDGGTMGPVDTKEDFNKNNNAELETWQLYRAVCGSWYLFWQDPDGDLYDQDVYLTLDEYGTATFEYIYRSDGYTTTESYEYILVDNIEALKEDNRDEFYCCYLPDEDSLVVYFDGFILKMERTDAHYAPPIGENGAIAEKPVETNPNCVEHDWIASHFDEKIGSVTQYTCSVCKTVGTVVDSVYKAPADSYIDQAGNQRYVYYYR